MVFKVSYIHVANGILGFFFYYTQMKIIFTECDGGTFGARCINMCGKCAQNEHCHHINGSCMNGCDPGYYGTYCSKSKSCTNSSKNFQNKNISKQINIIQSNE